MALNNVPDHDVDRGCWRWRVRRNVLLEVVEVIDEYLPEEAASAHLAGVPRFLVLSGFGFFFAVALTLNM